MTVQDVLNRKGYHVISISPDETVLDAARRMNEARIGSVVVFEPERGVMGIFTERDILCRVISEDRPSATTPVSEVMTTPVTCCKPESTLQECKEVMIGKRLRHLPVVDGGTLVGIISTGDLMAQEVELQQSALEHLHAYLNNWS